MNNKTILVVDDEETVVKVIAANLSVEGYTVDFAFSGAAALERIASNKPALILLDIRLGDTNGIDLLKEIKNIDQSIPIILVTGLYEDEQAKLAFEAGAADYITKPIDFYYLKNILENQLS